MDASQRARALRLADELDQRMLEDCTHPAADLLRELAAEEDTDSLKQQLAFAARQRDTAWAALNDRNDRIDHLTRAVNSARYEIEVWSRRYQDLAAEMANAVALRAPPVLISLPPDSGDWAEALSKAINPKEPT